MEKSNFIPISQTPSSNSGYSTSVFRPIVTPTFRARTPSLTPLLPINNNINYNIYKSVNNTKVSKNVFSELIRKKNSYQNKNKYINNSHLFYDTFKNDILRNENIIVYDLSNPPKNSGLQEIKSRFATIFLINIDGIYKYIVKKIFKKINPRSSQEDVEYEIKYIKYINQYIEELPFMLESIILRNVNIENVNKQHNVYIVTEYLNEYISLTKYILLILSLNITEKINKLEMILHKIKDIFMIMYNVGILHDDLNQHLNNIMIHQETNDIKLIDYGLCVIKSDNHFKFNTKFIYQKNMILLLILHKFGFLNKKNINIRSNFQPISYNIESAKSYFEINIINEEIKEIIMPFIIDFTELPF